MLHRTLTATGALALFVSAGHAQTTYPETEPNENRDQANGPFVLNPGDMLTGESHGVQVGGGIFANGSLDYFRLQPAAASLGIYRNTLTVSAPAPCTIVTVGFGQIDGVMNYRGSPGESNGLITSGGATGSTPANTAVWYGFGRSEAINLRIQNNSTTSTNNYTATYGVTQVTPTDLGTLPGGLITITTVGQGHVTNTAMWLYDSALNSIPGAGNDDVPDPNAHTVLQ